MKHTSLLTLLYMLMALLFGVAVMGCGQHGNGKIIVEKRMLGSFNEVEIGEESNVAGFNFGNSKVSGFHIKLIKDTVEYATIEFDENLMHHIETESVNNTLIIHTDKTLYSKRDININVHYKEIDHINATSFAEIIFATPYQGDRLRLNVSGTCEMAGSVFANALDMDITGAAEIDLKGKVKSMRGEISGAGTLNGFELLTDTCRMDITGAGEVKLNVQDYLKVGVTGAAEVTYKGSPMVEQHVTGAGEIKKAI